MDDCATCGKQKVLADSAHCYECTATFWGLPQATAEQQQADRLISLFTEYSGFDAFWDGMEVLHRVEFREDIAKFLCRLKEKGKK